MIFDISRTIERDSDTSAPWEDCDGHGPVSDWTSRDKRPGELVLSTDRSLSRYYDFATACKQARQESWDSKPYNIGQETKRQQAAKAAMSDYRYLRAWCNDEYITEAIKNATATLEGLLQ